MRITAEPLLDSPFEEVEGSAQQWLGEENGLRQRPLNLNRRTNADPDPGGLGGA